jgi:hypothetical protein
MSAGQVVSLVLPLTFSVGVFFLGLFFIRKPEAVSRFFTFGMNPMPRLGAWWSRFAGYIFCAVCIGFWILTPLYVIALVKQKH